MSDVLIARLPGECSKAELDSFVKLAAEGEEVEENSIRTGAGRAACLLWIADETRMVATAAVKNPFQSYRNRVFRKAGVADERQRYDLELGYIYVDASQRRRGHCRKLVQKAVEAANDRGIYATTRTDNAGMQAILREAGFSPIGLAYPSERNDVRLLLFVSARSRAG